VRRSGAAGGLAAPSFSCLRQLDPNTTDVPADRRRVEPVILDIYGDLASVRLSSTKVVDYMHLVRCNGEWKIINVLRDLRPEYKRRPEG